MNKCECIFEIKLQVYFYEKNEAPDFYLYVVVIKYFALYMFYLSKLYPCFSRKHENIPPIRVKKYMNFSVYRDYMRFPGRYLVNPDFIIAWSLDLKCILFSFPVWYQQGSFLCVCIWDKTNRDYVKCKCAWLYPTFCLLSPGIFTVCYVEWYWRF